MITVLITTGSEMRRKKAGVIEGWRSWDGWRQWQPFVFGTSPIDDADRALCVQKTTHTDQSEVTNGYGMLCGCKNGIFENIPTKEGE